MTDLKELADALGIDYAKCVSATQSHTEPFDFQVGHTYYLFRHNKAKTTYYRDREDCIRAMLRDGGNKMQGFGLGKWELLEFFKYEKNEMRNLKMIEMQKKRYSRYKFK